MIVCYIECLLAAYKYVTIISVQIAGCIIYSYMFHLRMMVMAGVLLIYGGFNVIFDSKVYAMDIWFTSTHCVFVCACVCVLTYVYVCV